jgi:hypothetical protein
MERSVGGVGPTKFDYANMCQSMHVGINNYKTLKSLEFSFNLSESYNDVDRYEGLFRK